MARLFLPLLFPLFALRTGLDRPFPPAIPPLQGEDTPAKMALGKLLFFDPILSGNHKISCATCHRPDRGLSDGGENLLGLSRNPPTLYNVAYRRYLFYDGRAHLLEEQALSPLFGKKEMNQDPTTLLQELSAIPEYRRLFAQAFPQEPTITLVHITSSLAAFERTLTSRNSPFDRYARGEGELTPAQLRGLALFRSLKTRCFECHMLPTFDAPLFKKIGVPDTNLDPGRGGVTGIPELNGAFRVPTLRNIALTPPYMHNGAFQTLREVILFYSRGGGDALGASDTDRMIGPFPITEREVSDLVAFLRALTDESQKPTPPEAVPSGLSVLKSLSHQ